MARSSTPEPAIHAVVIAGGAGERFWPRSRRRFPKPLLQVAGDRTLLEATLARAGHFASRANTWLVCGADHAGEMRRASGLPAARVLVEPERRNTAMAIGHAAVRIAAVDPDAVLVVLPADHLIPDAAAFERAIRRAVRAAAAATVLVTLGIRPTRAETGYGYIALGPGVPGHSGLHRVRRFVEKPDEARARRFVRGGRHLWNAGIFVWQARTFLDELAEHAPEVSAALARLAPRGRGTKPTAAAVAAAYRAAPSLPVDVALMERSRNVWTLPVRFRWSDVGTWASLAEELGVAGAANRTLGGDPVFEEAQGNLVWSDGRQVVLVGVEGLAVIDARDALLVVRLDRSQQLRRAVDALRARGREDLL